MEFTRLVNFNTNFIFWIRRRKNGQTRIQNRPAAKQELCKSAKKVQYSSSVVFFYFVAFFNNKSSSVQRIKDHGWHSILGGLLWSDDSQPCFFAVQDFSTLFRVNFYFDDIHAKFNPDSYALTEYTSPVTGAKCRCQWE